MPRGKRNPLKICPVCSREFKPERLTINFCSRDCSRKQITYSCFCIKCGKQFIGNSPNANQCDECRNAICLTCGKVFIKTKPYSKYCSRECVALNKDLRVQIGIKGSQTKVEKIAAGTFSIQKHEAKSHRCVNCGKIFVSNAPCPKYCDDCKTFTCVVCGEKFTAQFGTNPKTCSVKCRGLSQRNKLVCEYCGEIFSGASKRRFCSKICSDNFYAVEGNAKVTCPICGKQEVIQPWRMRHYAACSRECLNKWKSIHQRKPSAICTCIVCDKKFEVHPVCEAKKRKVCSRECLSIYRSHLISAKYAEGKIGRWKYKSSSTGKIEMYDSKWELERFKQLDALNADWTKRHGIRISYRLDEMVRHYVPDILIKSDNPPKLEEIKAKHLLKYDRETKAKIKAARKWCAKRGYDFVVLTEDDLFGNNKSK